MKKLVLIDSNAIVHRAYHSIPKSFTSRKGEQTNATYGFTTTLIKVLEDLKPDYVVASFDVAKKTFRHEQYAEYKATRVKADQELYDQIPRVKELLATLNIPVYEKEGFEADDVIGTIAGKITNSKSQLDSGSRATVRNDKGERIEVFIVTGDKDLFQLLNGEVFVYWLKKGLSEAAVVGSKEIKEIFGLDPADFIDLKALAGDASDNIPGVPGIGPKTATELIQKFDTLDKLYEQIEAVIPAPYRSTGSTPAGIQETIGIDSGSQATGRNDKSVEILAKELNIKPRILKLLIDYKDQALMSQKLATIHREVPIDFKLEDCAFGDYDKEKLKDLFEELGFHSLLRRFGVEKSEAPAGQSPLGGAKTKDAAEQKKKDEQLKLL